MFFRHVLRPARLMFCFAFVGMVTTVSALAAHAVEVLPDAVEPVEQNQVNSSTPAPLLAGDEPVEENDAVIVQSDADDLTSPSDEDCLVPVHNSTTDGCLELAAIWECPVDDDELSYEQDGYRSGDTREEWRQDWWDFLHEPGFRADILRDFHIEHADWHLSKAERDLIGELFDDEYAKCLTLLSPSITAPPITKIPKSGGDPPTPWLGLAGLSVLAAAGGTGVVVARRRSGNRHG